MAGKTIYQLIKLLGAEEVQEQLKKTGETGEKALKQVQDAIGATNNPLVQFGASVEGAAQTAGTGFGKISAGAGGLVGALSRLTPFRGLLAGIFAGIGAGAVGDLARLGDAADKARTRLGDLLHNQEAGAQAFDKIDQSAQRLGTTFGNLIKTYENLLSAQKKIQDPANIIKPAAREVTDPATGERRIEQINREAEASDGLIKKLETLNQLLRAGGASNEEAKKGAEEFSGALDKMGDAARTSGSKSAQAARAQQVLASALERLHEVSPRAADAIARAFEGGFKDADDAIRNISKMPSSIEDVFKALTKIGPEAQNAFDASKQKARSFGTAVDELHAKLERLFTNSSEATGLGKLLTGVVDAVNNDLDASANRLKQGLEDDARIINGFFELSDNIGRAWLKVEDTIVSVFQAIGQKASEFGDFLSGVWDSIVEKASAAWEKIKAAFSTPAAAIFNWLVNDFDDAVERVKASAQTAPQDIGASLSQPQGGIFDWISSAFDSAMQSLIAKAQAAWQQIKDIFSSIGGAFTGGGEAEPAAGFAGGGWTGSMARHRIAGVVHGQEYVEPAWVVAKPGVLRFLEILRRTGDLSATIQRFVGGFSMGGFVDRISNSLPSLTLPGYASGGLVALPQGAGLHPVTLNLASGRSIGGLSAPPSVIEKLRRELALDSLAASGRPPLRGRK